MVSRKFACNVIVGRRAADSFFELWLIIIKTQNNKKRKKDQLKHATNKRSEENQTRDTVLKTLLKTNDKKSQIHSDLKGMKN